METEAHFRCEEDFRIRLYEFCRRRKIMERVACHDDGGKIVYVRVPNLSEGIRTLLEEGLRGEGI